MKNKKYENIFNKGVHFRFNDFLVDVDFAQILLLIVVENAKIVECTENLPHTPAPPTHYYCSCFKIVLMILVPFLQSTPVLCSHYFCTVNYYSTSQISLGFVLSKLLT